MKRIICLSIFFAWATITFAQSHGSLHVDQDSRIESLIAKQRSLYKVDSSFSGYRIHIFSEIGNEALTHASEALQRVKEGLQMNIPTDLVSQDLREALYHLGSITGEITTDEVLGSIFSRFCIGK